jgi:hypothetical protein
MPSNSKTAYDPIYSCKKAVLKIVNNCISANYKNIYFFNFL